MAKLERIKNYQEIYDIAKSRFGTAIHEEAMEKAELKAWLKEKKILEKYRVQITKINVRDGGLKENIVDFRHILPPWLAYPELEKEQILKTDYCKCYSVFIRKLSDMEKSVYENTYEIPENWKHI